MMQHWNHHHCPPNIITVPCSLQ